MLFSYDIYAIGAWKSNKTPYSFWFKKYSISFKTFLLARDVKMFFIMFFFTFVGGGVIFLGSFP